MTKTVALLPCPFCNSDDVAADFTGDCWDVTCLNCHAGTIACGPAEADQHSAIAAWNSRTQTDQQLREEVERLKGLLNNARAASKRRGRDLLVEEADAALSFFGPDWEPLREVAQRAGVRSAAWLASRARDLQRRGLVESKWFGSERNASFKVWRTANPVLSSSSLTNG